jgi:hypothetical protein
MNTDKWGSLTERVLGAVFEAFNTLGAGFLLRELALRGIRANVRVSPAVTCKATLFSICPRHSKHHSWPYAARDRSYAFC